MTTETQNLLQKLTEKKAVFSDVLAFIETQYSHTPTAFRNGDTFNEASQNQGSAKVFSFAKLEDLSAQDTLLLFAEHYQNVLDTPNENNHQNIRQFIANGWEGISFEGEALTRKMV